MARIKITGYVEVDDLDAEDIDLDDSSGLSEAAHDALMMGEGVGYFHAGKSLDDVEAELLP